MQQKDKEVTIDEFKFHWKIEYEFSHLVKLRKGGSTPVYKSSFVLVITPIVYKRNNVIDYKTLVRIKYIFNEFCNEDSLMTSIYASSEECQMIERKILKKVKLLW